MCGFKILNMSFKIIFTWWNKQTFGTFLKTLFFGKYVGKMSREINIIKAKKMKDGLFIQNNIEATKITFRLVFVDASYN